MGQEHSDEELARYKSEAEQDDFSEADDELPASKLQRDMINGSAENFFEDEGQEYLELREIWKGVTVRLHRREEGHKMNFFLSDTDDGNKIALMLTGDNLPSWVKEKKYLSLVVQVSEDDLSLTKEKPGPVHGRTPYATEEVSASRAEDLITVVDMLGKKRAEHSKKGKIRKAISRTSENTG